MICPKCKKQLPDDAVFCDKCKTKVSTLKKANEVAHNTKKPIYNSRVFIILITLLSVTAACLAGFIAYVLADNSYLTGYVPHPAIFGSNKKSTPSFGGGGGGGGGLPPGEKPPVVTEAPEKPANPTEPPEKPTPKPIPTQDPPQDPPKDPPKDPPVSSGVINADPGRNGYILNPGTVLTEKDLTDFYSENGAEKTKKTVRLMVNEIYARYGYIFNVEEYKDYFSQKTWYEPLYDDQDYVRGLMNEKDGNNLKVLVDYEKKMGWSTTD